VADQVGSPTWARLLAEISTQVLAQSRGDMDWLAERSGLYHLAGSGAASRLEWARAILEYDPKKTEQITQTLEPALSGDFKSDAVRPAYSSLNCDRFKGLFGVSLPAWQLALKMAMEG
jgi:dTDP-4-dehydrorhamnose reductase